MKAKTKFLILAGIIILILVLSFTTKDPYSKSTEKYVLRMQKITGEWETQTYTLPNNIYLYIEPTEGTYALRYNAKNHYYNYSSKLIKQAVMDFVILDTLNEQSMPD